MELSGQKKKSDLVWGMTRGIQLALVYCFIAAAIYALNPDAFVANQAPFAAVIALYIGMGLLGGFLIGAMRSLLSEKRTAYIPAIAIGIVGAFALTVMLEGFPTTWDAQVWSGFPLLGVIFGVGGMYSFWPDDKH